MGFEKNLIRNVFNHYGPRKVDQHFGGQINNEVVKRIVWTFDYTMIGASGATVAGVDVGGTTQNLEYVIPANATILTAGLQVISAFVSTSTTSDLTIGLEQADGTDINVSGLFTAANLSETTLAVVGSYITGSGALVGKTIGANAGELVVVPSVDDFTAGKARVFVEYITAGL